MSFLLFLFIALITNTGLEYLFQSLLIRHLILSGPLCFLFCFFEFGKLKKVVYAQNSFLSGLFFLLLNEHKAPLSSLL